MTEPEASAKLSTCGCCEAGPSVPSITNPPGQSAITYRAGTHPTFLARMKARIHRWAAPDGDHAGKRPLEGLATRAADDPAIAMMDAWATVADVLTFYQERIANEGFLRTATERRSVLELARAIGYELDPGVAAETYAAFTVDDANDAVTSATVPAGTQIQSVPAARGELPQTFETKEEIEARVAWNAMTPRMTHPQRIESNHRYAYLEGTATNLARGDLVLLVISGATYPKRIRGIEADNDAGYTRIEFDTGAVSPSTELTVPPYEQLEPTQAQLDLTSENVETHIFSKAWRESDLQAFLALNEWGEDDVIAYVEELLTSAFDDEARELFALRERMGFFGGSAPYFESLPDVDNDAGSARTKALDSGEAEVAEQPGDMVMVESVSGTGKAWPVDWDDPPLSIWKDSLTDSYYDSPTDEYFDVYLERPVSGLATETWVVFERPARPNNQYETYRIANLTEASRTGFGFSAKVTGLDLRKQSGGDLGNNTTDKPATFKVRKSSAHVKSESMALAGVPVTEDLEVGATELWLGAMVLGLKEGQAVALTGEEVQTGGEVRDEILVLKEIVHTAGYTRLTFEDGLAYGYRRDTVRINANVVAANHGETVSEEVLGSGDGAATHQGFQLKKPPLTYTSAATASGAESTLSVRVDGVEWTEVSSLYGLEADSRGYSVRIDDDAKASVIFGDGKQGARLPTGRENVTATYRSGIGSYGEVAAGSLTLLKTRPFGIRGVTNPVQASGADDPEQLEDARTNAPLTVLTLDRIVSVQDHEDFARAFSGIGKAQATTVWDGESERVHVTVADASGDEVVSPLYENLLAAIEAARDPLREVILESFQPLVFFVTAKVLIDEAYEWEAVKAECEEALLDAFSFKERSFAQPVTAAEVLKVMHGVSGVKAVDLDELYKTAPDAAPSGDLVNTVLDARPARYDKDQDLILPAQLLLIHGLGVELSEMQS